ncbi:hypothetical protein Tco_0311851, partial [Tanacetum coccineum]
NCFENTRDPKHAVTTNLCHLDTTRHPAADVAVVVMGTADNTDHIAAEHN